MKDHIEQQREELPVDAWPIIAEEKCFDLVSDILNGLAFLNSKGLVHGDIKGNSYAAGDDDWLTDYFFVYFQPFMSVEISLAMSAILGRSAQAKMVFVEEFDMLYTNPPEIS